MSVSQAHGRNTITYNNRQAAVTPATLMAYAFRPASPVGEAMDNPVKSAAIKKLNIARQALAAAVAAKTIADRSAQFAEAPKMAKAQAKILKAKAAIQEARDEVREAELELEKIEAAENPKPRVAAANCVTADVLEIHSRIIITIDLPELLLNSTFKHCSDAQIAAAGHKPPQRAKKLEKNQRNVYFLGKKRNIWARIKVRRDGEYFLDKHAVLLKRYYGEFQLGNIKVRGYFDDYSADNFGMMSVVIEEAGKDPVYYSRNFGVSASTHMEAEEVFQREIMTPEECEIKEYSRLTRIKEINAKYSAIVLQEVDRLASTERAKLAQNFGITVEQLSKQPLHILLYLPLFHQLKMERLRELAEVPEITLWDEVIKIADE